MSCNSRLNVAPGFSPAFGQFAVGSVRLFVVADLQFHALALHLFLQRRLMQDEVTNTYAKTGGGRGYG
ncbi:MAG TPA: hypothetical protein VKD70_03795 [Candidatus Acidoferrum sp.]|nr:hypothetical protein [Candidatus Acidoferrum sp.]